MILWEYETERGVVDHSMQYVSLGKTLATLKANTNYQNAVSFVFVILFDRLIYLAFNYLTFNFPCILKCTLIFVLLFVRLFPIHQRSEKVMYCAISLMGRIVGTIPSLPTMKRLS